MIVTCPDCSTRYHLDPRALGAAGRTVRCAKCARTWHQALPEDRPLGVDLPSLADGIRPLSDAAAAPPVSGRRRPWARIGSAAVLLVILAGVLGAVALREEVVALWPPAIRLYGFVGLQSHSAGLGLEFRKVATSRSSENGVPAIVVQGEVVNVSPLARDVPPLEALLRDRAGKILQSWSFNSAESRLLPGGSTAFRTRIPQPSAETSAVVVTFAVGG